MATTSELAKAIKTALDETGDLITLRTRLEEEMLEGMSQMQSLSHKGPGQTFMTKKCKPAMPPEIILANNLICQYLEHVGLQNTSAVLCSESGLPDTACHNSVLTAALPSVQCSHGRPHLWHMVQKIVM